MEEILSKLLVSDNAVIQQGTKELREAFKKPESIPALCDIVVSNPNPQLRQSAAVYLRRRLSKNRLWNKVNLDIRNRIKQGMLQALVAEPEKYVKNSIAQFIGMIGKHEFPNNTWPEVLEFVQTLCTSESIIDREMGMYTLSITMENYPISAVDHEEGGQYPSRAQLFAVLFTNTLNSLQQLDGDLAYYTIMTMDNLVPVITGHQQMINVYHSLMPRIMECAGAFALKDEIRACHVMEIFDDLVEFAIVVVVPHINPLVQLCLQISSNKEVPQAVKIKAISFIGYLVKMKTKAVIKHKLIEPTVNVLFNLMSAAPENDVEEEYFSGDPDNSTPLTCATQTLDMLALHVPPEKLLPPLLARVSPALQGEDLFAKKAAYLALAVLAEGCAEHIRRKYLHQFLKCICTGITDPNMVVRNAALFALGQFSEHLQPEISQYSAELLPVLFEFLSQLCSHLQNDGKDPQSIDRMFYALETFCENLESGLIPYLPTLMERLFFTLQQTQSVHLKELTLSAISAAASAAKEGMLPYFPKIIELLNGYLQTVQPGEEVDASVLQLQAQAVDTLAILAQSIGNENFYPMAQGTLQLAMNLLQTQDDPDVKKSTYALFGALASVMKQEIGVVLPKIVEKMLESIQSAEGIVTHYKEEEKEEIDIYEDQNDSADEEDIENDSSSSEDDDDEAANYSVENAYIEEKEQACLALKEICQYSGPAFLPYLEKSYEEIYKLINYPQEDIRKAAIEALLQFCIFLHEVNTLESKQALQKALQMFVPKCAELIRSDDERSVVMAGLDAYENLLDKVKGDVLIGEGHREAIMNCIIDVLTNKTECQDPVQPDPNEAEDEEEAEQDEMLFEYAADVIPKFGKAITPDDFACYFPNVLSLISIRTKKQNSLSQRSFAIGTLAECMSPLGAYVNKFVPALMNIWLVGAKDQNEEVRNNAIFGLGEMVLHGKDCIFEHYPTLLQALSAAVSKETHAGTLDNICGALAKMIIANPNIVPLDQVFPVFMQYLPLRDDFSENLAVFKCFFTLYQQGHPIIRQNLDNVVKIAATVYHKEQTENDETKAIVIEFLKSSHRDFSNEFATSVSSLGPEVTESIQKLFAS